MSTNPTVEQTGYQRKYRRAKRKVRRCATNGCQETAIHGYRCEVHRQLHATREREAKRAGRRS